MIDFKYLVDESDEEIYIQFSDDYTGDYALDRIYDYDETQWSSCRVTKLDFSGKFSTQFRV